MTRVRCDYCHGEGYETGSVTPYGEQRFDCPKCGGEGTITQATGTRVRYHVALLPGYERVAEVESELNYYAEKGWRLVALDGYKAVFAEEATDD